jgi:hypothetical protein
MVAFVLIGVCHTEICHGSIKCNGLVPWLDFARLFAYDVIADPSGSMPDRFQFGLLT